MAVEVEKLRSEEAACISRFYKIVLTWDIFRIIQEVENRNKEKGNIDEGLGFGEVKDTYTDVNDYISTYEPLLFEDIKSEIASNKNRLGADKRTYVSLSINKGLAIIAFNDQKFDKKCIREVLSLGPTFVGMKFLESVLDVLMMYGAYSTTRSLAVSRIFLRFVWFGTASVVMSFLYVKALQEESKQNGNPIMYRLYLMIVGIYAGIQFFISFFMRIPACHNLTNQCDRWSLIRFVKWMRQERYYVGRGMYERTTDFIKYMFFWLVILTGKFAFAYFLQIKPLVEPTKITVNTNAITYTWHDLVSENNYNALTVAALWAPVVVIYLLDVHVFYTIVSAVWGFLLGARDRLGEVNAYDAKW